MGSFSCDAVDYICSPLMVRGAPSGILGGGVSVTVWLVVYPWLYPCLMACLLAKILIHLTNILATLALRYESSSCVLGTDKWSTYQHFN